MRLVGLQDNLSKVKAVEELTQQVLRFPDEAHLALVSELARKQEVRKKQVLELDESDGGKAERRKEFEDEEEELSTPDYRGRKKPPPAMPWGEEERQCSIDFRA